MGARLSGVSSPAAEGSAGRASRLFSYIFFTSVSSAYAVSPCVPMSDRASPSVRIENISCPATEVCSILEYGMPVAARSSLRMVSTSCIGRLYHRAPPAPKDGSALWLLGSEIQKCTFVFFSPYVVHQLFLLKRLPITYSLRTIQIILRSP